MHPSMAHGRVVTRKLAVAVAGVSIFGAGCVADRNDRDVGAEDVGTTQASFEQFEKTAYREPETGIYIVNGDTPVVDIKLLREFWERYVRTGALIVNQEGGHDVIWTDTQKMNLSYCVSQRFAGQYNSVVQAMADASAAWEHVTNVKFIHQADEDANCDANNGNVLFDVNPINAHGQYLARSFFPGQSRPTRNVMIDYSALTTQGPPNLTGILRHELGHTLGFRHEHTRPEAGKCFEDNNWRALTPYDSASVMHYPQCNGTGDRTLNLTQMDITGAQSLYGAPGSGGGSGGGSGTETTQTVTGNVAANGFDAVGPADGFDVVPGSTFTAVMTGTGDPDLYVRFGQAPTLSAFDCRPFLSGASETCTLTVPQGQTKAFIKVRGYAAATYSVAVTYTKPNDGHGATSTTFNGSVGQNESKSFGPVTVVPGTTFDAAMTGDGEADLYVKFGAQPTEDAYDCRPYLHGSNEECKLTVPDGQTQAFILVQGFAASTFSINVNYTAP